MKYPLLLAGLAAMVPSLASAQHNGCGLEQATRSYLASRSIEVPQPEDLAMPEGFRDADDLTIPVVVHVVWNIAEENISDERIHALIARLNLDYNRLNDQSGIREVFRPVVANMNLRFCLAQRTPSGEATSGIVRFETSVTFFNTSRNEFVSAMKVAPTGSPAWDPARYLNIWIADIASEDIISMGGGVGGFVVDTDIPGIVGSADDGVVLDYQLGTLPLSAQPVTHEVGHYLGLMHTWSHDPQPTCASSDRVDDTPPTTSATFDCGPAQINLQKCPPHLVQWENFLDYAPACAAMFTLGQRARARAFLGQRRPGLLGGDLCTAIVGVDNLAKAVTDIRVYSSVQGTHLEWEGHASNLRVFDANGRLMVNTNVTGTSYVIASNAYAPGVYTAIMMVNEIPHRARFVVAH